MNELNEWELKEFADDANELLDSAEDNLLIIDTEGFKKDNYEAIYRAFHSIKGAAGMLGLTQLQNFVHDVETQLQTYREKGDIPFGTATHFFACIDAARKLLAGQTPENLAALAKGLGEASLEKSKTNLEPQQSTSANNLKDSTPKTDTLEKKAKAPKIIRGRILLVDDEPEVTTIVTSHLQLVGFETVAKNSPEQALDIFKIEAFDLVISDIKMPKMSGLEFLEEVRKMNRNVPFILLSGYVTQANTVQALRQGVTSIISKPIKFDNLVFQVNNAVYAYKNKQLYGKLFSLFMLHYSELEKSLKDYPEKLEKTKKQINEIIRYRKELNEKYTDIPLGSD